MTRHRRLRFSVYTHYLSLSSSCTELKFFQIKNLTINWMRDGGAAGGFVTSIGAVLHTITVPGAWLTLIERFAQILLETTHKSTGWPSLCQSNLKNKCSVFWSWSLWWVRRSLKEIWQLFWISLVIFCIKKLWSFGSSSKHIQYGSVILLVKWFYI